MMIRIPRWDMNGKMPAGTWFHILVDGKETAILACPKCGSRAGCSDHDISNDGTITPSVMCNDCDYHESGLILEDWRTSQ